MTDDTTERFFHWMEANNIKRPQAASLLDVDERSLSTYRSRGLPQKKMALAERLMTESAELPRVADPEDNKVNISFTDEEFDLVQRAAAIVQTHFKDFVLRATIAKAQEELRKENKPMLRVAEDTTPYGTKNTGTEGK